MKNFKEFLPEKKFSGVASQILVHEISRLKKAIQDEDDDFKKEELQSELNTLMRDNPKEDKLPKAERQLGGRQSQLPKTTPIHTTVPSPLQDA